MKARLTFANLLAASNMLLLSHCLTLETLEKGNLVSLTFIPNLISHGLLLGYNLAQGKTFPYLNLTLALATSTLILGSPGLYVFCLIIPCLAVSTYITMKIINSITSAIHKYCNKEEAKQLLGTESFEDARYYELTQVGHTELCESVTELITRANNLNKELKLTNQRSDSKLYISDTILYNDIPLLLGEALTLTYISRKITERSMNTATNENYESPQSGCSVI